MIYAATAAYWPRLDYARHIGDLSYGIYIYGWPCEQLVVWLTRGRALWWEVAAGSLVMVLPLSWLSWHCVEKWALRGVRGRPRPVPAVSSLPEPAAGK